MLKSILLPLSASANAPCLVSVATEIAKRSNGTLNALFFHVDPRTSIPYMGEGLTADMIQQICDSAEEESKTSCKMVHEDFLKQLAAQSVPYLEGHSADHATGQWREIVGTLTKHVGRQARTADLSICLKPSANNPDSQEIFSDLLFRSGRPVLMMPESWNETSIGRHPLICWNGSVEGSRAVAAALPLLRDADKVTILQIGDIAENQPDLHQLAEYLVQHGIKAALRHDSKEKHSIAVQIHSTAKDIGADMLVIGAYSHARWREMILGGVTNWLSNETEIPVFMSH